MAIQRIIVTGHLGFIASAFCEAFGRTYEISGVDFAGWGSMPENLMPGVRDFRVDIADRDAVEQIVEQVRPDAIVNFAAESHVDRSNEDDSCFWRSNVLGARNLAHAASQRGIRMVHVSTDEVYGDASSVSEAWVESTAFRPKNPYAVTKAAAEMLLAVYAKGKSALDLVITRGANTVGARQFPEKAIPKAVWCFTHGVPFPLFRTPARRMWLHVADHVAGVEAALCKGQRGEVYNLAPKADCEAVTETVIERVRELVGRGEIKKVDDRDHYDLRYWMDASKAKAALGWQAQHGLEDTLSSTVRWYLEHPEWLEAAYAKASAEMVG
jgi:dTDP-glucose 4,6-dehydratase